MDKDKFGKSRFRAEERLKYVVLSMDGLSRLGAECGSMIEEVEKAWMGDCTGLPDCREPERLR